MYKYMYIYLNSNLRIGHFEQSNNPSCGCGCFPAHNNSFLQQENTSIVVNIHSLIKNTGILLNG